MSSKVGRWVLGLIYIFAVATIWIAASFVVQSVVDAGVSPFLITFICNSLFVVYLPLFEIGRYLEDAYGSLLFWRSKRSHLMELVESEKAVLLGQDVVSGGVIGYGSESVVIEEGDGEVGIGIESGLDNNVESGVDGGVNVGGEGSSSKGLDEKGRWTRMRVAKVSLVICPFWFLAQLTFNVSLKYTTVTVYGEAAGSMLGRDLEGLFQRARQFKKDLGDYYVSVEHLVLGFADDKRFGKQLFKYFQISEKSLKAAIESIRGKQSVIDQDPEGKYEALEKYGKDLTAMAREGKLETILTLLFSCFGCA